MDLQDSKSFTKSDLESMLLDEAAEPRALPFSLLEEITSGFSYKNEIGRGGFAVVYKAMLKNGAVAVKRLSNTYMYENEFQREVECLMNVKHKNIVRFIGYCSDTQGNMQRYNGKLVMADVSERLLCFEYLPKGTLDGYIEDASGGLEWRTRYQIIKGICQGLHSLHLINILHLDLKPSNILMDGNLIPKISDFGLSRSFEELQTRAIATKMFGTMGYLAPEFTSHVITHKFDLYSLGVIILEILTGQKECQAIENILKSWDKRLELWQQNQHREQIRVCAEIGTECSNIDPAKRPVSMKHVMDRLAKMEYTSELLDDPPLKHRFYPELNETIPCSLHLTNKADEYVVFRLIKRRSESLWMDSVNPMYGVMPPRSTCSLIMRTKGEMLAQETGTDLVLQSCVSRAKSNNLYSGKYGCNDFFYISKKFGNVVYEVALEAIYTLRRGETTSKPAVRPTIMKAISLEYPDLLTSIDAHPTEPWIVMGNYSGNVSVWNHESKKMMGSFKISEEPVESIKYHAKKKWIVAVTEDGFIHVYDSVCISQIQKITSFRAPTLFTGNSLGIHPTKPYVLSKSMDLWDGDKGWECTHTFGTGGMVQLTFNLDDPNIFASVSYCDYVEVWSLESPEPNYTLNGHSGIVNCLDFFKRGDCQYLITGSNDCTAKIWDLQTRECIHTLEDIMSPVIHVNSLPGRPYLVTCSKNATIHVWSSIDFRLTTTFNFSGGGNVYGLVCLMGSRRIAIGQLDALSIMDIDDDEEAAASEGKNEASACATG